MAVKITYHHERWPFKGENESCIFNLNTYLKNTLDDSVDVRKMLMLKDDQTIVSLIYVIKDNTAYIGHKASFGYPEIKEGTSFERVQIFFDEFYKYLVNNKIDLIRWLHYPEIYNPYYNRVILQSLLNLGLIIENSDLNHHLCKADDFKSGLRDDSLRRLKKIDRSDLKTEVWQTFDTSFFYDQVLNWRKIKGLPLNVEKEVLDNLLKDNSGKYLLFTVKNNKELIAASLGLRVTNNTLYYFIPSHKPEYDEFSPAIALLQKMHSYIRENDIDYLDLGISSGRNEKENFGLIHFKEKMGAQTGIKYSLIKRLK